MQKEIIIKDDLDETMVAVTEDQQLVEIYFERQQSKSLMGNLYKGKVENILPGMQAAFVDIGEAKNGFLYVNDAVPREMDDDGMILEPSCSIDQALKQGQELLVQIMKEPVGSKGARITTHPTIPGRFVVLMPTVNYIGISRRIEAEQERRRLKNIATELLDGKMGVIIRTVAAGVGREEIARDIKYLIKYWKRIQQKALKAPAPSLIHQDCSLIERMVRDVFGGEISKVHVNSAACKEKLQHCLAPILPEAQERIVVAHRDIMAVNDIASQLEKALRYKVWLKCGGYLIIDQMEAMTVIDVNTGKFVGNDNLAATVLQTNLEAAAEIARQIRLRNVGGIIIVDFIDMKEQQHKDQILDCLAAELKKDRVKTHILGLTQLGLLEMTRKKNGCQLSDVLQQDCPYCNGRGKVYSERSSYITIKKEVFQVAADTAAPGVYVEVNPAVAAALIGAGGSRLAALEKEAGKPICIKGNPACKMDEYLVRPAYDGLAATAPVAVGQLLDVFVEAVHDEQPGDGIARLDGFILVVQGGAAHLRQRVRVRVDSVQKTFAKACLV